LTFFAKSDNIKKVRLSVGYRKDKKFLSQKFYNIDLTPKWKKYLIPISAPETCDLLLLGLRSTMGLPPGQTMTETGSACFDDVSLTPLAPNTDIAESCRTIDLRRVANRGFSDDKANDGIGGWFDNGNNDLSAFPVKQKIFSGIKFDIISPSKNAGRSCVIIGGENNPFEINIPSPGTAVSIYFLHTAGWCGKIPAAYYVKYSDGEVVEIPLRKGYEIGDWWQPPMAMKNSAVAWRGANKFQNAKGVNVGVYAFAWKNPSPEKEISTIIFKSLDSKSISACLGITFSSFPPNLDADKRRTLNQNTSGWFEYPFSFDKFPIDLSYLNDTPAGTHGFVTVKGENSGCFGKSRI
jgi:hypothetical protein